MRTMHETWSIYNVWKLQEILNRTMRIMSIVTLALYNSSEIEPFINQFINLGYLFIRTHEQQGIFTIPTFC